MTDFKFSCLHCRQSLEAPPELFGTAIDCPACGKNISVPNPADYGMADLAVASVPAAPPPLPAMGKINKKKVFIKPAVRPQATGRKNNGEWVKVDFDEFHDKTTTTHIQQIGYDKFNMCLRHIKTKDIESLLLDCDFCNKDWFFARDGGIIFNCDQENIKINYHESHTDTESKDSTVYCNEFGYYEIDENILKKICNSRQLKINVSGGHLYVVPKQEWCDQFRLYCRKFYNNIYDQTAYAEFLTQVGAKEKTQNKIQAIGCLLLGAFIIVLVVFIWIVIATS